MSHEEQDLQIGRLIREHGNRRQEFIAFTAKLKQIGTALNQAGGQLVGLNPDVYQNNISALSNAKNLLNNIAEATDVKHIAHQVHEYTQLLDKLMEDQKLLKEYGVEK